jgi:glycosyltransferase involved in cell wall biosynthesis
LQALEDRVSTIELEHSGNIAVTRNRGVAATRGDLVGFLDDDDVWHPDKLERQIELLDSRESLGFVCSNVCLMHPDG